ncbi:ADP-ribose mitochondrial isoform X1, partial [Brachionus plicatilis]
MESFKSTLAKDYQKKSRSRSIPKSHFKCFSTPDNYPVFYPSSVQNKQIRPLFTKLVKPTDKICSYFKSECFLNIDHLLPIQDTANKPCRDPGDVSDIDFEEPQRSSFHPKFFFRYGEKNKLYPVNPVGITGLRGKGILSYWGVNHKIELIISRYKLNSKPKELEIIVMKNVDGTKFLLPGLFDQHNRDLTEHIVNAFAEEICLTAPSRVKKKLCQLLKTKSECIYQSYIDDPRNTDNAWIESSIFHVNFDHSFDELTFEESNEKFGWLLFSQCQNLYSDYTNVLNLLAQKFKVT